MVANILICTLILWALSALIVGPLTNASLSRAMAAEGIDPETADKLSPEAQKHWEGLALRHSILWDILVLGIAGFIGGLFGYYFIGISFQVRGWPGMIAFIGASVLGVAISGGA